jgi:acyl-CoA dehydrogenase
VLDRACAFAEDAAATRAEAAARQVASALYHVTTAIGFAHEARRANLAQRLALAKMVLAHRLSPRDPMARDDDVAALDAVLG